LHRAWRGALLYDAQHPIVRAQVSQCHLGCRSLSLEEAPLVLGITPQALMLGEQEVRDRDAVAPLAEALHALDLGAIRLEGRPSVEQLSRCVALLVELERTQQRGASASDQLNEALSPTMQFAPLRFDGLLAEDSIDWTAGVSGRMPPNAERARASWLWAMTMLLSGEPSDSGAEVDPQWLARHASDHFDPDNHASVQELTEWMQRLNDQVSQGEPDARGWVQQRLRVFIEHLDPTLREALLVGRGNQAQAYPDAMLRRMANWSDILPAKAILEPLHKLERDHERPASSTVLLLARLARCCRSDNQASQVIEQTQQTLTQRLAQLDPDEAQRLEQTLYELFHSPSNESFTPQAYQHRLVTLGAIGPEARLTLAGEAPFEPVVIRPHLLAVALACLPHPCEDLDALHAPWQHLKAHIHEALKYGKTALVVAALRAAQKTLSRWLEQPTPQSEAERRSSLQLLETLMSPAFIDAVLKRASQIHQLNDDLRILLEHAGPSAMEPVLLARHAIGNDRTTLREALGQLLAIRPPWFAQIAGRIEHADDPVLAPLLDALEVLTPTEALAVVEPLWRHPEQGVRLEACRAAIRLGSPPSLQWIATALNEPHPSFAAMLIPWLCARPFDDQEVSLLMRFILRVADDLWAHGPNLSAAAAALVQRSAQGRDQVCQLLQSCSWSLSSSKAQLARRLAEALRTRRSEPGVARALRRYRLSPASVLAMGRLAVAEEVTLANARRSA
jgi:hypothetical protein